MQPADEDNLVQQEDRVSWQLPSAAQYWSWACLVSCNLRFDFFHGHLPLANPAIANGIDQSEHFVEERIASMPPAAPFYTEGRTNILAHSPQRMATPEEDRSRRKFGSSVARLQMQLGLRVVLLAPAGRRISGHGSRILPARKGLGVSCRSAPPSSRARLARWTDACTSEALKKSSLAI